MVQYSCENDSAFRERPPASYNLMGSRKLPIDSQGRLHWHIANWGEDIAPFHQVGILNMVFGDWQEHLFPWRFVSTSDYTKADWKIFFANKNEIKMPDGSVQLSPYDFLAAPNVLAVQYEYYPGFRWSLCMIVNDDHQYGLTHSNHHFDAYKVVRHEVGHGLRLGHTDVKGDLMFPTYDPTYQITQDSISGLMAAHKEHLREYVNSLDNAKRFISLYGLKKKIVPKKKKTSWWESLFGKK